MPFWFFKKKQQKLEPQENAPQQKKITLGLALGGGGARGYAHLGALKAFEEAGIKFDMVSGASVGALAGALYCYGISADDMISTASNVQMKDIKGKRLLPGTQNPENVGELFKTIAGNISFEDLAVPLYVVAVDIISAEEKVINTGSVARAVSASCAVPGVFSPFVAGECHYVDGGLLNNIPSDVLKVRGADAVVAVDINSTRGQGTTSLKLLDVLAASMRISLANASTKGLIAADIVVRPDTQRFSSKKKDGYEQMIEEGYQAAMELVPQIKALYADEPQQMQDEPPQDAPKEKRAKKPKKVKEKRVKQ